MTASEDYYTKGEDMANTTFSGPVRAGTIQDTKETLGTNCNGHGL